ncbi:DMT family transporter [Yoonia sp.]|uniref:DMT family transporter n=1 Tax=Yoonia sp. TaxID=2212373 RepID=UPI002395AFCA|nr:DMT family transporter [Yoonia sp.]MDE0849948.1 DMT family transporter [Yoonia sp.]
MAVISDNMRGAFFMMGSMSAFTINDAFMKAVSTDLPLMQSIFLRGLIVLPLLMLLCRALGQLRFDLSRQDWTLILIRTVAEMFGALLFINALFNMPLANVSAILQALPLTVSLAAAVFFKEPLGWRRITAIVVGFAGVLLIVRPGGSDFNVYSLYAVGAVVVVTVRDLAARRISRDVPSTLVAVVAAGGVTLMAACGLPFETWVPIAAPQFGLLAGAAVFVIGGYIFSVAAMRVGEIGFVAPFRYTSLLVALILGFLVFGEVPRTLTFIGAGIVVSMGLFTLYREQRVKRRLARQTGQPI